VRTVLNSIATSGHIPALLCGPILHVSKILCLYLLNFRSAVGGHDCLTAGTISFKTQERRNRATPIREGTINDALGACRN
jgi:hypothetical protein